MRVKSSFYNILAGLGNQLVMACLGFVSRMVFIDNLGIQYLGVNGLFTNILAMLALAEAGIGASIQYSLYKPVAENDEQQIKVLLKLFKKAYLVIASVIFCLGLLVMPFLPFIVHEQSIRHLNIIYLIFLINTVSPFLFSYKYSFLNVCQKNYIITGIYSISSILSTILKILILLTTKNYILYLVVDSALTLAHSIILSVIVDKLYPFIKTKVVGKLDLKTKNKLFKNIKAIVMQNIGNYFIFGTDNIIISSFISLAAVGLYSNYNMLIEMCRTFLNQIFSNLYNSIGNLVASETTDKIYKVYKTAFLINFWLYSFFTIYLLVVINPLIKVWLGPKFLMSNSIVFILLIIFYERGMRNVITTIKTTAGIFNEDKYAPLIQALLNLVLSIILVRKVGINGVFIGTLISSIMVPFWLTPFLVYRKVFRLTVWNYFSRYFSFLGLALFAFLVVSFTCNLSILKTQNYLSLFEKTIICIVVTNLLYIAVFYKTDEFQYILHLCKKLFIKISNKKDALSFNLKKGERL